MGGFSIANRGIFDGQLCNLKSDMYKSQNHAIRQISSEKAVPACEAAGALRPKDPRITFQLGRALRASPRDDRAGAERLFEQAANAGSAAAMTNLGDDTKDDAKAVSWYKKAAEAGDPTGMYNLAIHYRDGSGIDQSDANAISWLSKAAGAGNQVASELLSEQAVNNNNFSVKKNRDIHGRDILFPDGQVFISRVDINACAAQCESNTACVAFSFNRWNEKCFLKHSVAALRIDPSSTVGVKNSTNLPPESNAGRKIERMRNSRCPSVPTSRKIVSNFSACQAICESDSNCIAFNFMRETRGAPNCHILYSTAARNPDQSMDSGYKYQAPSP
jgi:hypothetical protein